MVYLTLRRHYYYDFQIIFAKYKEIVNNIGKMYEINVLRELSVRKYYINKFLCHFYLVHLVKYSLIEKKLK